MLHFALIGKKLAHSKSPSIHTEIMKRNGIEGAYDTFEVTEENLSETLDMLKKEGKYRGATIALPYKELILPLLDEVDERVSYIGAVNTVLFTDGKAIGYNTEYEGFASLLNHNNISVKGKNAIILGSGGGAKTVAKVLLDQGIYDLTMVTRSKQTFHNIYASSYEFFLENPVPCDIIINCTPLGMHPNVDTSPLPQRAIQANYAVDLISNPKKTKFLRLAEDTGAVPIGGTHMLVRQAIESHKIWGSKTK